MWTIVAVIATVFVQAGMDMFFEPFGLPTLTGPFCLTTWLFLLPLYKMSSPAEHHDEWSSEWQSFVDELRKDEKDLK